MTTTRHEGLDALRTLAALFVIGIHTSGQYLAPEHWQGANGFIAALVQAVVQTGVPLFFMLSGAFVLAQPIKTSSDFYRKRLPRLLIPLAVWLPLYYLYFYIKQGDVSEFAQYLYQARGYFHLWFLPPLIALYLATPLLRRLIERVSHPKRLSAIAFGLLILGILGNLCLFIFQTELPIPLLFIPYIGYYLLGYTLKQETPKQRTPFLIGYSIATLAIALLLINYHSASWVEFTTNNLSPLIAIASICLFIIFSLLPHLPFKAYYFEALSSRSMGVYLIHIVVLDIVTKPLLLWSPFIMEQAAISIAIRWSLTALLSFGAVTLLQKVRILRPIL